MMAAAALRLPAPLNFLNLSRSIAGRAASDHTSPHRTGTSRKHPQEPAESISSDALWVAETISALPFDERKAT
jgi:hypothetical protein